MSYSLKAELHPHIDKNGLQKIIIRSVYNRISYRIQTNFKVLPNQFENGKVTKHPKVKSISLLINSQINELGNRFLDALKIR